jgi:hypothetical protein
MPSRQLRLPGVLIGDGVLVGLISTAGAVAGSHPAEEARPPTASCCGQQDFEVASGHMRIVAVDNGEARTAARPLNDFGGPGPDRQPAERHQAVVEPYCMATELSPRAILESMSCRGVGLQLGRSRS